MNTFKTINNFRVKIDTNNKYEAICRLCLYKTNNSPKDKVLSRMNKHKCKKENLR